MIPLVLAVSCLLPPVSAPVTDPFRLPPCPYCPGNRGLEYTPAAGTAVVAAAAGTVEFAGSVAGVRYAVVRHVDGLRATYGRLSSIDVAEGATVIAGQRIGLSSDRFYFGLRRDDEYIDPAPLLGELRHRARLVPADGSRGRPPPPPKVRCPAGIQG
jgi:murein DD-endopeptidase MepM/ murein hydrolase activator NlpD